MNLKVKIKQYSWWGGTNPPPSYLKTENQLISLGYFPVKAEGVIYGKKGTPTFLFNQLNPLSATPLPVIRTKQKRDKATAVKWAKDLLSREFLILDTETTGIKKPSACQIAIINQSGEVLINTLVKPTKPIEEKAQKVHGITNELVKNAPFFMEIYYEIVNLLTCQEVVIYNKDFDIEVLNNSSPRPIIARQFTDPMPYYAMWLGQWNPYHGDYQYPKLEGNHDALGDCLKTLEIIKLISN
jgi:hypothetical protein